MAKPEPAKAMFPDAAIQFYKTAWKAFSEVDMPLLEELAEASDFPVGVDSWLGQRWLSLAIEIANEESIAWVLSKRPEVNYVDSEGFTALQATLQMEATCRHSSEQAAAQTIRILDLLLNAGAEINLKTPRGITVLHSAAVISSVKVISHLLARGADPYIGEMNNTPLLPIDLATGPERTEAHALFLAAMVM